MSEGREMLCSDGVHRWDAQIALAKGGVEYGDPCTCGERTFGYVNINAITNLLRARLRASGMDLADSSLRELARDVVLHVLAEIQHQRGSL